MFIQNTTAKDIKLHSFEGYRFVIPTGVSWIWDKAGEHLLKTFEPKGVNGTWGFDLDGPVFQPSAPTKPAVIPSAKQAWAKEGKRMALVERFQINGQQVPRKHLIKVATERGVPNERITEFLANEQIDSQEIADAINALSVPDHIRFPQETTDESSGTTHE